MKVKAVETRNVTVDITPKDCFLALTDHFGLRDVFEPNSNSYYKAIEKGGKLIKLQKMTYISCHGSPVYEPTGNPITNPNKLEAFAALKKLYYLSDDICLK